MMHNNIAFIFKQPDSEYISLRENKIKSTRTLH